MPEADPETDLAQTFTKTIQPAIIAAAVAILLLVISFGLTGTGGRVAGYDRQLAQANSVERAAVDVALATRAAANGQDPDNTQLGTAIAALGPEIEALQGLLPDKPRADEVAAVKDAAATWTQSATQSPANPDATSEAALFTHLHSLIKSLDSGRASAAVMNTILRLALGLLSIGAIVFAILRILSARDSLSGVTSETNEQASEIERLRKHKALLNATLSGIGDAMIAVDLSSRITYVNPVASKLTGWDEADSIGKDAGRILSLASEKNGAALPLPFHKVFKSCVDAELETGAVIVSRSGPKTPVAGNCAVVWDDTGKLVGAALIVRDISEKRGARIAIQTTEAQKLALIDTALDAVVLTDQAARITEFNPAAEKIFSTGRSEVIGHPISELIDDIGDLSTLQDKRVERVGRRKSGLTFPAELAVTRIPGAETAGFAAYVRDITERKAADNLLLHAKEAAEEDSRAKSRFLNDMSDELRTPLNAVIGYSEMLQEEATTRNVPDLIPDLQKIHGAGKHLLTMVNDVLNLSRIEGGQMEVRTEIFPVRALLDELAESVTPILKANANTLDVRCLGTVGNMNADRQKLRQSLLYLLSNASRFAQQRALLLEATRQKSADGDHVQFRVADASPVLPEAELKALQQAASKADDGGHLRFGGHGLGLVIARQLTELMGGRLVGTREAGRGATFTIDLPAGAGK